MDPRNLNTPLNPFQGLGSNLAKLNMLGANMAKVNSLGASAARIDPAGVHSLKCDVWNCGKAKAHTSLMGSPRLTSPIAGSPMCDTVPRGMKAWQMARPDFSVWQVARAPVSASALLCAGTRSWSAGAWTMPVKKRVQRPELNQSQRDWLARGIRSWASAAESNPAWEEANPKPREIYHNLGYFLLRRYAESGQKRGGLAGIGRRAETLWSWVDYLHRTALPRLASSLDPSAVSRELLAALAPPPGWTKAVRSRVVLEDLIPRALQRLAQVILPNAPSHRSRHLLSRGIAV